MTFPRTARLFVVAALLAGAAGVLTLGATLVAHVASGRGAGFGLFAWSAGFAVLLPVTMMLAALPRPMPRTAVVPNAGWKIPGAGQ
ncbi:MAG TPA: hypothetical protein VFE72_03935 [Lysobacter sp.]|nr:hypothetical protein [Lysobacter sp.]